MPLPASDRGIDLAHNGFMSVADLRKLHALHKIDLVLADIRVKAAALDPGRAIQATLTKLQAEADGLEKEAHKLSAEQLDLELRQKSLADKRKKFEKELFGGSVVNPREVETMQKEIDSLKRQIGDIDEVLLGLMDKVPPALDQAAAAKKLVEHEMAKLAEHQQKVMSSKRELEAKFKEVSALRPAAVRDVPVALLEKYELIRKNHGGIAMTEAGKNARCSRCGTGLPTKIIEAAKDGRLVTCESCHRIVYATDGLV